MFHFIQAMAMSVAFVLFAHQTRWLSDQERKRAVQRSFSMSAVPTTTEGNRKGKESRRGRATGGLANEIKPCAAVRMSIREETTTGDANQLAAKSRVLLLVYIGGVCGEG